MTRTATSKTASALLCTIVFSTTCVLSAVGPAMAGGGGDAAAVRIQAETPKPALLA